MASPTPTERIIQINHVLGGLTKQADLVDSRLKDIEVRLREGEAYLQQLDKRLAIQEQNVARLEKKIEELSQRRWEMGKLVLEVVLVAVLGGALSKMLQVGLTSILK